MTEPVRDQREATSFGAAADLYERIRPTYPEDAVAWVLPPGAPRVLDLGAGTGKLTRALVARGLDAVAVDPSAEMLARLRVALPAVETHIGTAEAIPLPDAAVDAVVVGQAWHWVDVARAVPEVARVPRPSGTLGLLWNARDVRVDWIRRYNAIVRHVPHFVEAAKVGAPFSPIERHEVAWTAALDEAALVDLAASRSYSILAPPAEKDALLDEVRTLFAEIAAGAPFSHKTNRQFRGGAGQGPRRA